MTAEVSKLEKSKDRCCETSGLRGWPLREAFPF